jgi:nitroreductase
MQLRDAIEQRASAWEFTQEPVRLEDLRTMVELAGRAPSVNNAQPWRYVAVINPSLKQAMVQAVQRKLDEILRSPVDDREGEMFGKLRTYCCVFDHAPAVLAVLTRTYEGLVDWALSRSKMRLQDVQAMRGHPDVVALGASIQNLLLAATDLGYSSCWMTGPLVARDELQSILEVQPPWNLGALVAIGRAAGQRPQARKQSVDEILIVRG